MLQFHKELITQNTNNLIEEGDKSFCTVANVEVIILVCLVVLSLNNGKQRRD
jgi:hypothetical protein